MTLHSFTPNYRVLGRFDGYASPTEFLDEHGMFAASEDFARAHGGPLTRRVLDAIPAEYRSSATEAGLELNIDVRIHDLTEGDYPASPGWHCDSPFREVAFDAHAATQAVQRNLVATISDHVAGVSDTEFLSEPLTLNSTAAAGSAELWADVDTHLQAQAHTRSLDTASTASGELVEFDCQTLHRATPARRDGVRLFARVSLWTPPAGHQPGLTTCEQVYRRINTGRLAAGRHPRRFGPTA